MLQVIIRKYKNPMAATKSKKKNQASSKLGLLKHTNNVSVFALVAIIVMLSGAGIFLKLVTHASVAYLDRAGCELRGRNWVGGTGNPCGSTCITGSGTLITNATYNYCSNTESKLTSATCITTLHRAWLVDGCARRYQQTVATTANAPQCYYAKSTYTVANPYDKCSVGSSTVAKPTPAATAAPVKPSVAPAKSTIAIASPKASPDPGASAGKPTPKPTPKPAPSVSSAAASAAAASHLAQKDCVSGGDHWVNGKCQSNPPSLAQQVVQVTYGVGNSFYQDVVKPVISAPVAVAKWVSHSMSHPGE